MDSPPDLVDKTLTEIVHMLRTCAAEHFYRYDLNTLAGNLEDIIEEERERMGGKRES